MSSRLEILYTKKIRGTAITPFTTAAMSNDFIGSTPATVIPKPITVAATITP